jgi:uncharacterized membrane protein
MASLRLPVDGLVTKVLARTRQLPIQRSVDVAVPIDVAWDQWMRFEYLPEGIHRVLDVERDDDRLHGRVGGAHLRQDWEAEIIDERIDESFAWRSAGASTDCSGLLTFHELAVRLTRLELHLDVVPGGLPEAVTLVLHVADRRAEAELRRFKAHVEALDPDDYPPSPSDDTT